MLPRINHLRISRRRQREVGELPPGFDAVAHVGRLFLASSTAPQRGQVAGEHARQDDFLHGPNGPRSVVRCGRARVQRDSVEKG